jgi:glycosyltransferase involved in cell wall biosynthesis
MTIRVALVTPFAAPSIRGNAITVERIARGLRGRGVDLEVWDLSVTPDATVERGIARLRPTLVHAFHAFRAGPLALRVAERAGVPLVVTITGTDANHDLLDPERAEIVRRVLAGAGSVTVFHELMARRLVSALPALAARVTVIPQSVFFEGGDDAVAPAGDAGSGPSLLFPAGIRAVKNPRFPLAPLDRVAPRYPGLALSYVGPVLEAEEGAAFSVALRDRPWARYLGPRPHPHMRALIERADVVLNCSASEGGMANSVLEALALGRAVLASNIEGNRSLVEDGVTGLLFDTPAEFGAKAEQLLADRDLRRRLGAAGREIVSARFPPAREPDGYLSVYAHLTVATRRA